MTDSIERAANSFAPKTYAEESGLCSLTACRADSSNRIHDTLGECPTGFKSISCTGSDPDECVAANRHAGCVPVDKESNSCKKDKVMDEKTAWNLHHAPLTPATCWHFIPPGSCPRHPGQATGQWTADTFGMSHANAGKNSEACLTQRRRDLNKWCGSSGVHMKYNPPSSAASLRHQADVIEKHAGIQKDHSLYKQIAVKHMKAHHDRVKSEQVERELHAEMRKLRHALGHPPLPDASAAGLHAVHPNAHTVPPAHAIVQATSPPPTAAPPNPSVRLPQMPGEKHAACMPTPSHPNMTGDTHAQPGNEAATPSVHHTNMPGAKAHSAHHCVPSVTLTGKDGKLTVQTHSKCSMPTSRTYTLDEVVDRMFPYK